MAEVKNAFIKSKMNKDLDSRLIPQGEYRDAVNIQVSKSEGDDVGALENVLGNVSVANFEPTIPDLSCIGYFVNEFNNTVFLFFTDYTDTSTGNNSQYNVSANNFIYSYNVKSEILTKLVEGNFLNFSKNKPIIGVNLLENLLFWTDNRNQTRKINIDLATSNGSSYYNSEDKISVAKYNPYQPIELIEDTITGAGVVTVATSSSLTAVLSTVSGNILAGAIVSGNGITVGTTVVSFVPSTGDITFNQANTIPQNTDLTFTLSALQTTMQDVSSEFLPDGTTLNPYYNPDFSGDPQFLEDKFPRFSYRFKFIDGEYSIFAPFTQPCFIPKQDGYFIEGDEEQTFASTIVGFMENKVTQISLQIPLPSTKNNLTENFLITEIDILYKESDALAVQVVDTIMVDSLNGTDSTLEYSYLSTKPIKTLPESDLIRVYDKIPVKAFGQEIVSNRVVYSNFQNKHNPPSGINYQVGVTEKLIDTSPGSAKSRIEYPNHNLKENRNYQVGIVLADRYGRQSSVILSNNTSARLSSGFGVDTVYLPYNENNNSIDFAGNSLKILFNSLLLGVGFDKNETNGTPGLWNGDVNNSLYNPLGWYSYKVVVKQIEQEYYNVYSAGAMKGLPYNYDTQSLLPVLNQETSFITLINDNINKVPRDLSEVGPQDKTFRSSVRLFGRVKNNANGFSNIGNEQYLPTNNRISFTTNNIEDLFDLFDVANYKNQVDTPVPITDQENPFHSFYKSESNPFIAEFITSTNPLDHFGIINPTTISNGGFADVNGNQSNVTVIPLNNFIGDPPANGDLVTGTGVTVDTYVISYDPVTNNVVVNRNQVSLPNGTQLTFTRTDFSGIENLTILETTPTVSRLDIFWESTTAGLISDLNLAISDGENNTGAAGIDAWNFTLTEASSPGDIVVDNFYFVNILGAQITPTSVTLESVFDQFGNDAGSKFTFIDNGNSTYDIQTAAGAYFYADNPNSYTYTFTFRVNNADPNLSIDGDLGNICPSVSNPTGTPQIPLSFTKPATTIISTINAVNGSNPAGGKSTLDLVNIIVPGSATGSAAGFVIVNNTSVINTAAAAQGTGSFTLRTTDAFGCAIDTIFYVNISVALVDSRFNLPIKTINDGDGLALWFTANTTSLTSNIPLYIDNGSTGTNGRDFTFGLEAPGSLSSTVLRDVCQPNIQPTGNSGTFTNVTSDGGLTTSGTFYVWVQGVNTTNLIPGATSRAADRVPHLNTRYAIQYRDVGTTTWSSAIDITGIVVSQSVTTRTWNWDFTTGGTDRGLKLLSSAYDPSSFGQGLHCVRNTPSTTGTYDPAYSGQVFAFNAQKEYRIILGNLSGGSIDVGRVIGQYPFSQYGFFSKTGVYELEQRFGCNNPINANTPLTSKTTNLYVHDFNAPDTNVAPDYSTNPGVYRYQIATSNLCNNAFISSGNYYAAEPFAKYITQLYTDDGLVNEANVTGSYRFRRMNLLNTSDTEVFNPEYTKDGAYTASFSNGNRSSLPNPCLFS